MQAASSACSGRHPPAALAARAFPGPPTPRPFRPDPVLALPRLSAVSEATLASPAETFQSPSRSRGGGGAGEAGRARLLRHPGPGIPGQTHSASLSCIIVSQTGYDLGGARWWGTRYWVSKETQAKSLFNGKQTENVKKIHKFRMPAPSPPPHCRAHKMCKSKKFSQGRGAWGF